MWETFTQGLRAWAETMGFINKRTDLKNAADVRQAAMQASEQKAVDQIRQDVAKGNLDAIRNDIAE